MVQAITTYRCDICGTDHPTALDASGCEERGVRSLNYPTGVYVGGGVHGWWNGGRQWVLTMPQLADPRPHMQGQKERHAPHHERRAEWATDREGGQGHDVGRNWWLPVWRVLGTMRSTYAGGHILDTVLWTPEHANRTAGSEAMVRTSPDHRGLILLDNAQLPDANPAHAARYMELRDLLAGDPAAFVRKFGPGLL